MEDDDVVDAEDEDDDDDDDDGARRHRLRRAIASHRGRERGMRGRELYRLNSAAHSPTLMLHCPAPDQGSPQAASPRRGLGGDGPDAAGHCGGCGGGGGERRQRQSHVRQEKKIWNSADEGGVVGVLSERHESEREREHPALLRPLTTASEVARSGGLNARFQIKSNRTSSIKPGIVRTSRSFADKEQSIEDGARSVAVSYAPVSSVQEKQQSFQQIENMDIKTTHRTCGYIALALVHGVRAQLNHTSEEMTTRVPRHNTLYENISMCVFLVLCLILYLAMNYHEERRENHGKLQRRATV